MAHLALITIIFTIITAWSQAEVVTLVTDAANVREPRHLFRKKCYKYGTCGGHQGGYQGYQGGYQGGYHGGYQGYQGYGQQHPPINIAISQSQSSASQGGYGGGGYYGPNNYQHNYPGHGGPGYGGYGGYGGYNRPGNYNNGYGSYNNQFNGNYNGGNGGGYGFNGPFFDEGSDEKPIHEDSENGPEGDDNYAFAGAYARSSATARKSD